jgi:hypothetical protein
VIMDRLDPHSFIPLGDQHRLVYGGVSRITVPQVYQAAVEVLARSRTDGLSSL